MSQIEVLEQLESHLRERARIYQQGEMEGSYVLYWMRTAMRLDENPALDVARQIASLNGIPLLLYQGLSSRYQFASDRHHTFILEGVRDLQEKCAQQGISYAFYLETSRSEEYPLKDLANAASIVVTEDMPVSPPRSFLLALKRASKTSIVLVDTACIVPMQKSEKSFDRAFEFRNATSKWYQERKSGDWPESSFSPESFPLEALGFPITGLSGQAIESLVASCQIDHLVPPSTQLKGGCTAGYQRWEEFLRIKINSYANKRNDPTADATSRMSPYLHYGMVSPFRIAREAASLSGRGPEKFLDELLIWRELAYHYCFHNSDHQRWSTLPEWARDTLERHASDPRPAEYSWDDLYRGNTTDPLWNACQKSLLREGELHNNLRMTWGKAIINWDSNPPRALRNLIDLNNRLALDGRDPASFGGLLWCFGLFDRPFAPEQNISGCLRVRPTNEQVKRKDISRFLQCQTNVQRTQKHIGIVGSGLSGLVAARNLMDHGYQVTVFEKSRGVGGRMSTRRTDLGNFDHGAQYFTVRDKRFESYVESWRGSGLVKKWPDCSSGSDQRIVSLDAGKKVSVSSSVNRFVASPNMNSLCKHLAKELSVETGVKIDHAVRKDQFLYLKADDGSEKGPFDSLVISAPAEQSAEILKRFPELSESLRSIVMDPCWACLATFDSPITDEWCGAFLQNSFLSWASRNSSKPDRVSNSENVVIHSTADWARENWNQDGEWIANQMLAEFWRVTGCKESATTQIQTHRWKYAISQLSNDAQCYGDAKAKVVACGDWAHNSRVEGAFLSGAAAFGAVCSFLKNNTESEGSKVDLRQQTLF